MSTLSARGLSLKVGDLSLLTDLDFDVAPGEIVAVEGPSGAGKSTLLRALALLDEPAAGTLSLDGEPPAHVPTFRSRVAYLAQRPTVLGATVREDLARPFSYRAVAGAFDEDQARARLGSLGLGEVMDQDPATLSEGERQRVCLARTLGIDPAVLLLDEPTSALDPDAVARVEAALRAFIDAGGACVLVSHDPEQRARLATRRVEPFA